MSRSKCLLRRIKEKTMNTYTEIFGLIIITIYTFDLI